MRNYYEKNIKINVGFGCNLVNSRWVSSLLYFNRYSHTMIMQYDRLSRVAKPVLLLLIIMIAGFLQVQNTSVQNTSTIVPRVESADNCDVSLGCGD